MRTPRPRGTSQLKSRSGTAGRLEPHRSPAYGPGLSHLCPVGRLRPRPVHRVPALRRPRGDCPTRPCPPGPPSARPRPPPPGPPWAQARPQGRLPPTAALFGCKMAGGRGRRSGGGAFPPGLRTLGPSRVPDTAPRGEPWAFPTSKSAVPSRRASDWAGPGGAVRSEAPPPGRATRARRAGLEVWCRRWG